MTRHSDLYDDGGLPDWSPDGPLGDAVRLLRDVVSVLLDPAVRDQDVRTAIFERFPREDIVAAHEVIDAYLAEAELLDDPLGG